MNRDGLNAQVLSTRRFESDVTRDGLNAQILSTLGFESDVTRDGSNAQILSTLGFESDVTRDELNAQILSTRKLRFYNDEISDSTDRILSTVVVALETAVLPLCADVFDLRRRRAQKVRLGTRKFACTVANPALQPVLQRRLRPR